MPHWPPEMNDFQFTKYSISNCCSHSPSWIALGNMNCFRRMQFQAALEYTTLLARAFAELQLDTDTIPVDKLTRKDHWTHCCFVGPFHRSQRLNWRQRSHKKSIAEAQLSYFHCVSVEYLKTKLWNKNVLSTDE